MHYSSWLIYLKQTYFIVVPYANIATTGIVVHQIAATSMYAMSQGELPPAQSGHSPVAVLLRAVINRYRKSSAECHNFC